MFDGDGTTPRNVTKNWIHREIGLRIVCVGGFLLVPFLLLGCMEI